MSDGRADIDRGWLRRVIGVVRSWDGPNSRLGLEMDLNQMPWGPFDALGQHLSLLLPSIPEGKPGGPDVESEVERALRHVEHAADRCGEFAQSSDGSREMWLSSQRTWEWIRRYLTRLWVQEQVQGDTEEILGRRLRDTGDTEGERASGPPQTGPASELPSMPGAAATLRAAAKALRTVPLSGWRDTVGTEDPEAPTREEAIQTLLGVARLLDAPGRGEETEVEVEGTPTPKAPWRGGERGSPTGDEPGALEELDFEPVSIDFAEGYDQGYRMGRKVGWALGSRRRANFGRSEGPVATE